MSLNNSIVATPESDPSLPSAVRKPKILVVDDEVAMVRSLELLLRPLGEVIKAYSVPEARDYLEKNPKLDCVVTDVSMPEASGLLLLDHIKKKIPEIPVVVITAYSSVPQAVQAMHRGAFEYVVKPFENADLFGVVRKAISKKGVISGETKKMPTGWICNSESMREFLEKADRVAEQNSPILLFGEIGAGKGRAARWLHEKNPNNEKKIFVAIDGRAHEDDSPLLKRTFGREVGSIFVAEAFSLTSRLQDKLFELIKEERIRIIAGSSSAAGLQVPPNFRDDLFQALTSLQLRIPSLKEREADLEALIGEKLISLAEKLKIPRLELLPEAMLKIRSTVLPGNVRELETLLERAALEARAGVISAEGIHFDIGENLKRLLPFSIPVEDGWNRLEMLREALERELILNALEKYPKASNTQIAAILGTTRRILELRMKAYSIREDS